MGLGNVSIGSTYPEVSRDEMLSKLNKLKQPFLKSSSIKFSEVKISENKMIINKIGR